MKIYVSLVECLYNKYGTISHDEGDGLNCGIAKCKPGYMERRCQFCDHKDLAISGKNGFVLDNGQGVQCSKHLRFNS